jgi:hypothetical protein
MGGWTIKYKEPTSQHQYNQCHTQSSGDSGATPSPAEQAKYNVRAIGVLWT